MQQTDQYGWKAKKYSRSNLQRSSERRSIMHSKWTLFCSILRMQPKRQIELHQSGQRQWYATLTPNKKCPVCCWRKNISVLSFWVPNSLMTRKIRNILRIRKSLQQIAMLALKMQCIFARFVKSWLSVQRILIQPFDLFVNQPDDEPEDPHEHNIELWTFRKATCLQRDESICLETSQWSMIVRIFDLCMSLANDLFSSPSYSSNY